MSRAVFLDRDNTLIACDGDLGDPDEVVLIDGVADGLRALREAGYHLVVTTNQGGVARGKYTEADVDAVHQRISGLLDQQAGTARLIDRFYYCPYHPEGVDPPYRREHPWRKPNPGMLLQAARDMGIDLQQSWMIGDQGRDIEAGRAAGCRTVLVNRNGSNGSAGGGQPAASVESIGPTLAVERFEEAVRAILDHEGRSAATTADDHQPPAPTSTATTTTPESTETTDSPPKRADASPSVAAPAERSPAERSARSSQRDARGGSGSELEPIRRTMQEMVDELRNERIRRGEFTMSKMAAALVQMLVLLFALLALLQLESVEGFFQWMAVAGLGQLVVIALLLLDGRS